MCACALSHSVVSDSLRPHGLQPTRLLCPWDSPGKNPGVGCQALPQGLFPTQELNPGLPHCRWILDPRASREAQTVVRRRPERLSCGAGAGAPRLLLFCKSCRLFASGCARALSLPPAFSRCGEQGPLSGAALSSHRGGVSGCRARVPGSHLSGRSAQTRPLCHRLTPWTGGGARGPRADRRSLSAGPPGCPNTVISTVTLNSQLVGMSTKIRFLYFFISRRYVLSML